MKIIKLEVGSLGTNCYIVYCEKTRAAAVIDPGGNAEEILAVINGENLKVECIINTHGHADHIQANAKIKQATCAPIFIHRDDADMLTSIHRNLSAFIGGGIKCEPADRLLQDGDIIHVGEIMLTVIHTPGHTPGGICLLANDVLLSGDTLFAESIGRTDFPGGSYRQLIHSIKEKLMVLDDNVRVLPGHGPETTIGWERQHNPFIQ
ncbi:MBL fold metallo-hydrolase [Sporolituus thermophilus]|uniref:Glyoxylase, beta-lactamase superfamily II n=1 Tax=Sporolituus thermophilus DSM 23256 TaxID=1123285 RepID=A0A1G7IDY3_9FIRM|nr:MBL fold metallo-hydrolase [Sporolituus thermophilus]SDF10950.1 Glyoxylase, beta-lactamase superfamily II [Sporolituus thermophilus DSM 23256]